MSHELRTPLNSIMALSRVLFMGADQRLSVEEQRYLEIIERNGRRLSLEGPGEFSVPSEEDPRRHSP